MFSKKILDSDFWQKSMENVLLIAAVLLVAFVLTGCATSKKSSPKQVANHNDAEFDDADTGC